VNHLKVFVLRNNSERLTAKAGEDRNRFTEDVGEMSDVFLSECGVRHI